MQESDGSIPSGITDRDWSVGAVAARHFGMAEDWVQFPDGPLTESWAARLTGRCLACTEEIGVRFPGRSTEMGSWSNGTTPPWRGGNPSSILGGSTDYGR